MTTAATPVPTLPCSRCGRDTPIAQMTPYVGERGFITRFCISCEQKLIEERLARRGIGE
jgi:hypothetical protein